MCYPVSENVHRFETIINIVQCYETSFQNSKYILISTKKLYVVVHSFKGKVIYYIKKLPIF